MKKNRVLIYVIIIYKNTCYEKSICDEHAQYQRMRYREEWCFYVNSSSRYDRFNRSMFSKTACSLLQMTDDRRETTL